MRVDVASKVGTRRNHDPRRDDVPFHPALLMHLDLLGRSDVAGDLTEHDDGLGANLGFDLAGEPHRERMLTQDDRALDATIDGEVLAAGEVASDHHRLPDVGPFTCWGLGRLARRGDDARWVRLGSLKHAEALQPGSHFLDVRISPRYTPTPFPGPTGFFLADFHAECRKKRRSHHIDRDVLHAAYAATRKDGAVGLDGQTADDYAQNLEANLQSLLDRFKSGQYVAPPVRRVHIPKGDGRTTRPIGIPTFEDKVLQRAVMMVLESVYEQDFRDCSFGFRPGRSAHQALQHLWEQTMLMGGGWVIDLDIQGFFDALDHSHLRRFLDQRVRDGVLRRAIDKWLRAGVLEDGRVSRSVLGTPQGGVVSPLLANIYLHHVLDVWFTTEVQPRLRGRSVLVRYADDVVIVVERESDAHRVLDVLPKRLGRFGLTMQPEKSRLVRFVRPRFGWRAGQDGDRFPPPGPFDFLGFTHYWCIGRNGSWVLKRKTAKDRLRRSLTAVNRWC